MRKYDIFLVVLILVIILQFFGCDAIILPNAKKEWQIPNLVGVGGNYVNWDFSSNNKGDLFIAWSERFESVFYLYVCHYSNESGWSRIDRLVHNAEYINTVQVSVTDSGEASIVWVQNESNVQHIHAVSYTPESGWNSESLDIISAAENLKISRNALNDVIIVWQQNSNIWAVFYSHISGWGTEQIIDAGLANASYPDIVIDNSGNVFAVWEQSDTTGFDIWMNNFISGVGWGMASSVVTNPGEDRMPQVVQDGRGNIHIIWLEYNDNVGDVWTKFYSPDIGWMAPERIEVTAGTAYYPQITINTLGEAVAVWMQHNGTRFAIWANVYTPGIGWGSAKTIDNERIQSSTPHVAIGNSGEAIAVWVQEDTSGASIWGNQLTIRKSWKYPKCIGTGNWGHTGNPKIAIDNLGNGTAIWTQTGINRTAIWTSCYSL